MDANQCQVCLNYFLDHTSLQNHIETHTKRELYQCIVTLKSVLTQLSQTSQWVELEQTIKIPNPAVALQAQTSETTVTSSSTHRNSITKEESIPLQSHNGDLARSQSDRELLSSSFDLSTLPPGTDSTAISSLIQLQNERLGTVSQPQAPLVNDVKDVKNGDTSTSKALNLTQTPKSSPSSYSGDMQKYVVCIGNGKAYQCDLCGRMFTAAFALRRHLMSHNNERPDKCTVCGKGFIGKQNLEVHMRVHTGEKPYACEGCGKKFSQHGSLMKHREKHCPPSTTDPKADGYRENSEMGEDGTDESGTPGHVAYDSMDGNLNVVRYEEIPAVGSNSNAGSEVGSYTHHSDSMDVQESQQAASAAAKEGLVVPSPVVTHVSGSGTLHSVEEVEDCEGEYDGEKEGDRKFLENLATSYQMMVQRILDQNKEEENSCKYCLIRCESESSLEGHVHKVHTGPKPYRCNICGKCYGSSYCLRRHFLLHIGEKAQKCHFCHKGPAPKEGSHGEGQGQDKGHGEEKTHRCQFCGKGFSQYSAFHNHLLSHYTGMKEVEGQGEAGEKGADRPEGSAAMDVDLAHLTSSVLQANPGLSMALSQYSNSTVTSAIAQLASQTPGGMNAALAQLSQSSTAFAQFSQVLQLQMQLYTREMESRRESLVNTDRVYPGYDPYTGTATPAHAITNSKDDAGSSHEKDKSALDQFMKSASASGVATEENPIATDLSVLPSKEIEALTAANGTRYQCEYCDLQFNSPITLERHQRIHRGEKPFSCQYCDKSFTTSYCLRRHVMTHTGERPHKCSVCGKRFIEKQHLNIHFRIHTGEKPYECKFCGKRFPQGGSLYRHVQTHVAKGEADLSTTNQLYTMHKFENLAGEEIKDLSTPVKKKRKKKMVKKELNYEGAETETSPTYPVTYQGYTGSMADTTQQDSNTAVDLSQLATKALGQSQAPNPKSPQAGTSSSSQPPAGPQRTKSDASEEEILQHLDDVINDVAAGKFSPRPDPKPDLTYFSTKQSLQKQGAGSVLPGTDALSDEVRRDYLQQQYNQLFGVTSPRSSREMAEQVSRYLAATNHESVIVSQAGGSKVHYAAYPGIPLDAHTPLSSVEQYAAALSSTALTSGSESGVYPTAATHYPVLATQLGETTAAGGAAEIYPCNICGGRYASLIDLVNHRREHSDSAELRCELCGELFTAAENLIIHYQSHAIESIHNSQAEGVAATAVSHAVDATATPHTNALSTVSTSPYLPADAAKLASISDQEAEAAAALAMSYLNGIPAPGTEKHAATRAESGQFAGMDTTHFRSGVVTEGHPDSTIAPSGSAHQGEGLGTHPANMNSANLQYQATHLSLMQSATEAEKAAIPKYMESGNILSSFSELASQVMQGKMIRNPGSGPSGLSMVQSSPVLVLPSNTELNLSSTSDTTAGAVMARVDGDKKDDDDEVDHKIKAGRGGGFSMDAALIEKTVKTVKLEDGTTQQMFECQICKKQFFNKRSYYRHVRLHTGEQLCKCDLCGKGFTGLFGLRRHMIIHSGQKPHKCDFCGKGFIEKQHLQSHRRIHTGEKPFKCAVCGKCFTQYGTLHRHKRTHTKEKPYGCPLCPKRFGENRQLTHHLKSHSNSAVGVEHINQVKEALATATAMEASQDDS